MDKGGQTETGGRECRHSKPRNKVPVKSVSEPEPLQDDDQQIGIIKEETEEELALLESSGRPMTGGSHRPMSSVSTILSRPGSRYTRPSTSKSRTSSVETHSGAASPTRRTISRASSRKSRPASSGSRLETGHSSDSDTDNEDVTRHKPHLEVDFATVDITDEKAFDTDLEIEVPSYGSHMEMISDFQALRLSYCMDSSLKFISDMNDVYKTIKQTTSYDRTGRTAYIEGCKKMGVVPASYFLRHMHDTNLSMKHHGLGSMGMKPIAMSLMTNTQIVKLDLSDNWLGHHGGLAVCEMLKENCFITFLDLSDNKFGTRMAEHLGKILNSNSTLTHVVLAGNDFDDTAAVSFADVIMNTTKIEHLNLSRNVFGELGGMLLGPAIAENSSLKELDLSWNSLRRKGAIAVAQGIKHNIYMKKISLSWNGFGLDGSVAICDALKNNQTLEEIDLTNNRITAEGAVIIGKGLSVNETLVSIKMGKNPMQSAGCYGICAAILRNPNSIMKELDFSDILVNNDFNDIYKQVQEQCPELKLKHGGMEPPKKPKKPVHPMVKLANYIQKNNLRLVDFFNKFDKDGSMSVTYEEFQQGIEETGIKLSSDEVSQLLLELDSDGDGEINYSELVIGHTGFQEQQDSINTILTATQPRPMTT
ncbi:leucine-rich repeat-containing protein 74A-like isoform X2 [Mizuhopecten yessoensis]|uniref:leucine-rich repeat-containing protein 74A-like isoform X2 n=1 Tax=Mizuhopecten yessoensis TaxID=6573 RepID=UPI000B458C71|nr:leucine-rich repeat-containing protein 74A-like isoform X2 [Mizuhopecten yessoensis]